MEIISKDLLSRNALINFHPRTNPGDFLPLFSFSFSLLLSNGKHLGLQRQANLGKHHVFLLNNLSSGLSYKLFSYKYTCNIVYLQKT